jgi:hypothetical protein
MESNNTLIRLIDEEIERLQQVRAQLLVSDGHRSANQVANGDKTQQQPEKDHRKSNSAKPTTGTSRRGQIEDFLHKNGASTSAEILHATGMPRGSLGFTLNRNEQFIRTEDGRWRLST